MPNRPATIVKMNQVVDEANVAAIQNGLVNEFERLGETWKQIFWFYYLFLFTDGGVGGDPKMAGSAYHHKVTSVWSNLSGTQFSYRAKKMAPLAQRFFDNAVRPTGNIPMFLIPRDGGRRPDVVTLDTLRWVRNPRDPQPNEQW